MIDVQWTFISISTSSIAHFALRIILGRELGSEGLGVYTLAFTIYLLGLQFAAFGIGAALTKYVAEFIENNLIIRNYVSSGITSSIITGTLMGVVLFFLAPFVAITLFHTPELEGMIRLTALCYPFIAIQKAVLGTLNGFRKMKLYALLNIVQNVTVVIASLALVHLMGLGLMGAVIGFVGPTIIISALCPVLIRDSIRLDSSLWNTKALHATTIFGLFIVLEQSVGYLSTQVDSILIGYYMDPTEVGIYAVAVLLIQTLTLVPSAVQGVTAPLTARLFAKGDIGEVRKLYHSTLKKSLLISIILALTLAITSPYLIVFFFTKEYSASYIPLLILLPGYAIGASFGAVGSTLSSIGKVHIPFRISIICGVLNLILNILLIPVLGINGAALSTTTTMLIMFCLTTMAIRNYL